MSADTQRAITALLADGAPDDPGVLHLARACRVLHYGEGRLAVSLAPGTEGLLDGPGAGRVSTALRTWIAESLGVPLVLDIRVERGGWPWTAGHSRVRPTPAPPANPPQRPDPFGGPTFRDATPAALLATVDREATTDMPLRRDRSPADASAAHGGGYPTSEASQKARWAAWVAWFGSADSLIGVSPSFSRGWDAAASGETSCLAAWLDWHRGVAQDDVPSVNLDFARGFDAGLKWRAQR